MAFENTREVLGERATLDGLIDGTLEELKDDCLITMTKGHIIPNHTGLKTIVLPNVTAYPGANAFSTTRTLNTSSSGSIPGAEIIVLGLNGPWNSYVFQQCENVSIIDAFFGSNNNNPLYIYIFGDCKKLNKLIIRDGTLRALSNISAFSGTPFASGGSGGTLYVKESLIPSYQSATNWSTILSYENNTILPIEGSIYDGYYADGTPIE